MIPPTLSISSRFRHVTFSSAISVLGETAEKIWRQVNMAIVKSSLRFTTIIHGSLSFLSRKALLPWNFKCRGDKRLVACWRPVLKFWSQTPNFWSHWRPVSRNFGPWTTKQYLITLLYTNIPISHLHVDIQTGVLETYFTDHKALWASFHAVKCHCQRKPGRTKRSRSAVYLHLFTV